MTFVRRLMAKKNPLVEKKKVSVSQQSQELAVVVPSLFFKMNSCVCRVLHDHTKCSFVLFLKISVSGVD